MFLPTVSSVRESRQSEQDEGMLSSTYLHDSKAPVENEKLLSPCWRVFLYHPLYSHACPWPYTSQVRENLMWALGYNIIALPLAAGVFLPGWGLMLSPAVAGAIMSCSSVAVVTNSLLLRRKLDRELGPVSDIRSVTGA